jgi:hypothetical protein
MDTPTTTQRLADVLLDGRLKEYVAERRAANRSWRLIARDLYEHTGVDVTYETLRRWFPDIDESQVEQEKRTA